MLFLLSFDLANGATFTSIGAGNYSSGANWDLGTVPTSADNIIINSNITLDANYTVTNLTISASGTLSPETSTGNIITVQAAFVNNGTFIGDDLSGGTIELEFNSTSTFSNSGTFTCYLITVSSTANLTLLTNLTANSGIGDFVVNGGTLVAGSHTVNMGASGQVFINASSTFSTGVAGGASATFSGSSGINFDDDVNYIFTSGCTNTGFNVSIVGDITIAGASITTSSDITVNGSYTMSSGSLGISSNTWEFAGSSKSIIVSSGFTNFGAADITGSYTSTGTYAFNDLVHITGTFTLSSGLVDYYTEIKTTSSGAYDGTNGVTRFSQANSTISVSGGSSVILGAVFINGSFTTNSNFTIKGDLDGNNTASFVCSGSSTITFANSTSITIASFTSMIFQQIIFNGTSTINFNNSFTLQSDLTVAATQTVNMGASYTATINTTTTITNSGTLHFYNLIVSGTLNSASSFHIDKNLSVSGGGTLNSTGTITMTGAASSITNSGTATFNNLTISGTVSSSSTFTIAGDFDGASTGTFSASAGTITFNNSASKNIANFSSLTFFNATFQNTSVLANSCTIASDLTIQAGANLSQTATYTSTFSGTAKTIANGGTLALGNTAISGSISTSSSFSIQGGMSGAGTFTASSGTITFSGASKTISTSNTVTFNLLSITGTITCTATISISTDFNISAGASFNSSSGTVNLVGNSNAINNSGTTTFGNLNISASSYYIVVGNITISGTLQNDGIFNPLGTTTFNGSSKFINNSGTLDFTNLTISGSISSSASFSIAGDLVVSGTFTCTGNYVDLTGTTKSYTTNLGTCRIDYLRFSGTYTGNGIITIDQMLIVSAGGSISSASATMRMTGNPTTLDVSGTFNPGTITVNLGDELKLVNSFTNGSSSTYNISGTFNFQNHVLNLNGSTLNMLTGSTFESNHSAGVAGSVSGGNFHNNTNYILNSAVTDLGFSGRSITQINNLSTVNASISTASSFSMTGHLSVSSGSLDLTSTTTTFNSSITSTITNTGTLTFGDLVINATVTTTSNFTIASSISISAVKSFVASSASTITAKGTITNSGTLTFFNLIVTSGQTLSTSSSFTIAGNLSTGNAASLFDASSSSTITFTGASKTLTSSANAVLASAGFNFYNLVVSGSLTHSGNHNINIKNNLSCTGTFALSSGSTVTFTGAGSTITNSGTLTFKNVVVASTVTTALTSTSSYTVSGTFTIQASGKYASSAGTLTFSGASAEIINNLANVYTDAVFYNISTTGTSFINGSDFQISNNLTNSASTSFNLSSGTIYFTGNSGSITNSNTLKMYNVVFAGTTTTSSDIEINNNLTVNSTKSFVSTGNTTFNGTSGTITNASTLTFHDITFANLSNITLTAAQSFDLTGDWTQNGNSTFSSSSGSMISFDGSALQTMTMGTGTCVLEHLTLNNLAGLNLSGDIALNKLTISQNLTLMNGDLDLNGDNIITLLSPSGMLYEDGGLLKNTDDANTNGHIHYQENYVTPLSGVNVAGLGFTIFQKAGSTPLGNFIIKRFHATQHPAGGTSVRRYYYLNSSATSIESTFLMEYDDSEMNSLSESELSIVSTSSIDNQWSVRKTLNLPNQNRVKITETVDSYSNLNSIWTAAVPIKITIDSLPTEIVDARTYTNSRLINGTKDLVVLGLKISSTNLVYLNSLKVYLDSNSYNQFQNLRLISSVDTNYYTSIDNSQLAVSAAPGDSVTFSSLSNQIVSNDLNLHYFLVADVSDSAYYYSPSVKVEVTSSNLTFSDGIVFYKLIGKTRYRFQQKHYVEVQNAGVNSGTLYPDKKDIGIIGFKIYPRYHTAGLKQIKIKMGKNPSQSLSGNFRLIKSEDNNLATTSDNSNIALSSLVPITSDSIYTFELASEVDVPTSGYYYFIKADSANPAINKGSEYIYPHIPYTWITSNRSVSAKTDTLIGLKQVFESTEVEFEIDSTSLTTITKQIPSQTIMSFNLTSNAEANFTSFKAIIDISGNIKYSDINSFQLAFDENSNNRIDDGEQIAYAIPDGSHTLFFTNFAKKQNFTGTRHYLIATNIAEAAQAGSKVRFYIPNKEAIAFQSPAKLILAAPLYSDYKTVRSKQAATYIKVTNISKSSVMLDETFDVLVEILDNEFKASSINSNINVSLSSDFVGTLNGTLNSTIFSSSSFTTFKNISLSGSYSSSGITFTASDNSSLTEQSSSMIYLVSSSPSTFASNLQISSGSPAYNNLMLNSWTNGDGDSRLILMKLGSSPSDPIDGTTYTAQADIGLASGIGTNLVDDHTFVVYKGSGLSSPTAISNLTQNTQYYFKIVEYNGTGANTNYYNSSNNPVYVFSTDTSTYDIGNISTSAIKVLSDQVVDGLINNSSDVDWYYLNAKANDNIIITLCGGTHYFEIYKKISVSEMRKVRESQNVSNCQITIINNTDAAEYFIKLYDADRYSNNHTYKFSYKLYPYTIFSQPECNCP